MQDHRRRIEQSNRLSACGGRRDGKPVDYRLRPHHELGFERASGGESGGTKFRIATTAQIVLAVDQSFYSALKTQALFQVAQQTVQARQALGKDPR